MMITNLPIAISWPKDLISKIDFQRGDIPRSKYLLRIIEKAFENIDDQNDEKIKNNMDLLDDGLGSLQSSKSMST
jgi:hypothetical protein